MITHRSTTTARTPSRLPTPPPLALDLTHAGRPVGWVHGDSIGFGGFASNVEAAHAAWVAYRALARRLAKTGGHRPIPVDTEHLTLTRRGDVDLVMASGRPIARVLLPGPTSRSGADSFGFEIHVPAPRYEARMRGMAYLVYRTLRKSGVRWALWTRDRPAPERPAPERRDDTIPAARTTPALRWATVATVVTTASVVGLMLALAVPERIALPLGALGLMGLLGSRLFVSLMGWPVTRAIRSGFARREPRTTRGRPMHSLVASGAAAEPSR